MELANESERGIFHLALVNESKLLEEDVLSVTSSYHLLIQQEVLCWLMVG